MNPYTAGDKVAYQGRNWTVKYPAEDKVKLYKPQPSGEPKEMLVVVGPWLTAFEEKQPRIPTWQRRLRISVSDCPPVSERLLVPEISRVSKVRTPCPEKWEVSCREMFDREGVSYPHDWRGTKLGKRKADAEEQRSISATVWIPREVVSEELLHDLTVVPFGEAGEPLGKVKGDFVVFNHFEYTMKLLVDGKASGWRITESV